MKLSPERIAELRAEIEHRRTLSLEKIGPLLIDEVDALLRIATEPHHCAHGVFCPHHGERHVG